MKNDEHEYKTKLINNENKEILDKDKENVINVKFNINSINQNKVTEEHNTNKWFKWHYYSWGYDTFSLFTIL